MSDAFFLRHKSEHDTPERGELLFTMEMPADEIEIEKIRRANDF
jgi:hypothetical protein